MSYGRRLPSRIEWPLWALFWASVILPLFAIFSQRYWLAGTCLLLFATSLLLMVPYAVFQFRSVSVDRYLLLLYDRAHRGTEEDKEDLYDVCTQAIRQTDLRTFKRALTVLSQIGPETQRGTVLWHQIKTLGGMCLSDPALMREYVEAVYHFAAPFTDAVALRRRGWWERKWSDWQHQRRVLNGVPPALSRPSLRRPSGRE